MRYDDKQIKERYYNKRMTLYGTEMHDLAERMIKQRMTLPKDGTTVSVYVNDCVAHCMTPEVGLYYSNWVFGTCDAISFDKETRVLRIFDMKTGKKPCDSADQLLIYASLFCMQYGYDPDDIVEYDLRIYQFGRYSKKNARPMDVHRIISKIKHVSALLDATSMQEEINGSK